MADRLTSLRIKHARPGRHGDGKGLYLLVKPSGSKSWVLRVQVDGRRRDFGLGSYDVLSLAEAREKAREGRKMAKAGLDPSLEWRRARQITPDFATAARRYHDTVKVGWRNPKHAAQWLSSLERHAFTVIESMPVDTIDAPAIQKVLLPIWLKLPETARRVRQRIGSVLDYAHAQGWRETEAPMRAVSKSLPRQPAKDRHFAAMPYPDVPKLIPKLLDEGQSMGRLALAFTILTAARSGETRGAVWSEIDLKRKLWTIPAERMKASRAHAQPLNRSALAILKSVARLGTEADAPVFPGNGGRPLSDMTLTKALKSAGGEAYTVHGFRSSFRDWAAERHPDVPGAVAEAALAHAIPNKVEAAYRRTLFLDQRRDLLNRWGEYLAR